MYLDKLEKIYSYKYSTLLGDILVSEAAGHIVGASFTDKPQESIIKETALLKSAYMQLREYLSGTRKYFDLPIMLAGSEFAQRVWSELINIPYGETRNYLQIAKNIGNEKAFRAVGNANGLNPIVILIPCHRVIHSSGDINGYSQGNNRKKYLLDLEKKYFGIKNK